jgi:oligopeptide/dipeptide ABC transporter ATP-binding protein
MRQRVMIAMATIVGPSLLVADEPTTALDVTIQSQIIDVLRNLQRRHGTSIIFISHDLSLVSGFADRTMVMYAGQAVERDATDQVVGLPRHPYTQSLIAAVPDLDGGPLEPIVGTPPDPRALPAGCAFAPRCERAAEKCATPPPLVGTDTDADADPTHDEGALHDEGGAVRCWFPHSADAAERSAVNLRPARGTLEAPTEAHHA